VFWIAAAARNLIWHQGDDAKNPDVSRPENISDQARRQIFLAVSKDGDPTHGFPFTSAVATDYNDWPLFEINGEVALFTHWNSGLETRVYDAGKLASGQKDRIGHYTSDDYGVSEYIPVRHHHTDPTKFYFVGTKGDGKKLVVNAIYKGKLVTGPTLDLPFGAPLSDAVYRNGTLHLVGVEGKGIRYVSFPILVNENGFTVGSTGDLGNLTDDNAKSQGVVTELIIDPAAPTTLQYDVPSVEVTKFGDVIVAYRAYGSVKGKPVPEQMRYSVLYHGESKFRRNGLVKGSGNQSTMNSGFGIDFAKSALDPDDETMWIAGVYAAPDVTAADGTVTKPIKLVIASVKP
jgi:hypothetical protein